MLFKNSFIFKLSYDTRQLGANCGAAHTTIDVCYVVRVQLCGFVFGYSLLGNHNAMLPYVVDTKKNTENTFVSLSICG